MKHICSKNGLFLVAIILLISVPLSALDYGLVLDATPSYEDTQGFTTPGLEKFNFVGIIRPWLSVPLNDTMDLHLSAGLSFRYEQKELSPAPELFHTEFTWQPGENSSLGIGRVFYADPLGFIAAGFFDGIAMKSPVGNGTLSLGIYYTGLLYKKTAYITVTPDEAASYQSKLDYGDFSGSYFAPRRALGSLGYSFIAGEDFRFNFALLGQIDLNAKTDYYSSEYFIARAMLPLDDFIFGAGFAAEIVEDGSIHLGLAGLLDIFWMVPNSLQDQLSLKVRYASGHWGGDALVEFRPLTTVPQGNVLRPKLSGLTIIEAEYLARLHETFSLGFSAAYFVQNDLGTYQGIFSSTTNYFLGAETYVQLIWNPASDLSCALGGGIFLPSLGNTSAGSSPLWRVNVNVTLAVL